jgi:Flp pilus assembly protein TadD
MSISLSKKKEAILERYRKVGGESADELKDMTRAEIKRGNFTAALKLISKVEEGAETDIELLDLGGVCLMHLKQFDAAVQKFKRLIALDKHFNKQVYISLALCYNQLNRTAECLSYVIVV